MLVQINFMSFRPRRSLNPLEQVTSEPGIVRLFEEVEKESRTAGNEAGSMSALITAALDGAIAGRLDNAKVAAVFLAMAGVAGADWFLLCVDRLAPH